MISLDDLRSDLLPELESRYGEIHSRVESSGKRLFLKFRTEESALCGLAAINEYIDNVGVPIRAISSTEPRAVILIGEDEIL